MMYRIGNFMSYIYVDDLFGRMHDKEEFEESNELLTKLSRVEYAIVKRIAYLERMKELV